MILVVTGGRTYPWGHDDASLVLHLFSYMDVTDVWHGGAVGVDTYVERLARMQGLGTRVFLAEPTLFPEDHKLALMKRNETMIDALVSAVDDGHPGCVMAFPGGSGTNGACTYALRRKLNLIDLRNRPLPGSERHG